MSKVKCDNENCGKEFNISLQTKKLDDDIERTFFICPKCKTEYTVIYTDEESRLIRDKRDRALKDFQKLQRKSRDLVSRNKKNEKLINELEEQYKKYQELTALFSMLTDNLRARMGD